MVRLVGGWDILVHPWFFLSILTMNLGLYAVMVYSGTLNKTLIGMMLGGLIATLATILYSGMGPSAFAYGGPFGRLGVYLVESAINPALESLPEQVYASGPLKLGYTELALIGQVAIDGLGLMAIVAGGVTARILWARSRRRETPAVPLPLDVDAASPL
jgi:hypothetical protein